MLKVEYESANRVNHIMIADKNNILYCHLKEQVIKWKDNYYLTIHLYIWRANLN